MNWSIGGRSAVRIRHWQDQYLAYHPLTGNTHFLDFVAGALLVEVAAGDRSSADLYRFVAELLDLHDQAEVAARVDEILAQLDALGLVEPALPC